jgi:type I restriction enzyme S subunit
VDKLTYPSEQPVRLCNYIDVYEHEYITDGLQFMRASATQSEIDKFGLRIGDVIITKDSETPDDIGVPAVVDYAAPDLVCGYHLGLLRPKVGKDGVDSTFLAKQLSQHRIARYFGCQANGLTRYGLPIRAVTDAPLWLPEPEEQKAVGAILRLTDRAIAKTEAVIAKLKQVRAGLLHDLLTRGLDEHGHLRDPVAHPEYFQSSSLGRIPREWEVIPLTEKCDSFAGGTPSRGASMFFGGSIPWVKSSEVNQDEITATEELLTPAGLQASSAKWIPAGTPLIAMYGATAGQVSWLAIDATANQAVLAVVPRSGDTSARFVYWLLRYAASRVVGLATGSGQPNLSKVIVDRSLLAFPYNVKEQKRIASVIDKAASYLFAEQRALRKLQRLKSGLMADLLTGRVRMPGGVGVAS